jgi:hypothetical protein
MATQIISAVPDKLRDIEPGEKVRTTISYEAESSGLEISASTGTAGYRASLHPLSGSPPVLGKKGTFTIAAHLTVEHADGATAGGPVNVDFTIGSSEPHTILITVKT